MPQPRTDFSKTANQPVLKKLGDGTYHLSLTTGCEGRIQEIVLNESQIRTFTLAALHLLPEITPKYVVPEEQEIYRLPARKFAQLDDHSIQVWLREMEADTLISFLWLMDDEALAGKIIRNMSAVAGKMLVEDLNAKYGELDPDSAPMAYVAPARQAAIEAVAIFERLRRAGNVIDL